MTAPGTERVLLLGATGMLGTYLAQTLPQHFATYSPVPRRRNANVPTKNIGWLSTYLDLPDLKNLNELLDECKPDVIINCIAVTPTSSAATNPIENIHINSLLPHLLAKAARTYGSKLIHISTDGVFSGARGNYAEDDIPDPLDMYGRSKLLGEVVDSNCLTIRTTFYGRSSGSKGLIDWLLTQKGQHVKGFKNYIFSAVSMKALASAIIVIIKRPTFLSGLYHVGGPPISKYDLLLMVSERFGLNVMVEPVSNPVVNRSLDSSRFWQVIGQAMPQSVTMIDEMRCECLQGSQ